MGTILPAVQTGLPLIISLRNLKSHLRETRFTDDESLNIAVKARFDGQGTEFYFKA